MKSSWLLAILILFVSFHYCSTQDVSVCGNCTVRTIGDALRANASTITVSSGYYAEEPTQFDITWPILLVVESNVTVEAADNRVWLRVISSNLTITGGKLTILGSAFQMVGESYLRNEAELEIRKESSDGEVCVDVSASSVWYQQGHINIRVINNTGIQVYGLYNQYNTANITVKAETTTLFGIRIRLNGTWNQHSTAMLDVYGAGASGVHLDSALWNQLSTTTMRIVNSSIGVNVRYSRWIQSASLNINARLGALGVSLETSNWTQDGELEFHGATSSTAVSVISQGKWDQIGLVNITLTASRGIIVESGNWSQSKAVSIYVQGGEGVSINPGNAWLQLATFQCTELGAGICVTVARGSVWTQTADVNMIITTFGVEIYGVWEQRAPTTIQPRGLSSYGVMLMVSGVWNQIYKFECNAINSTCVYLTLGTIWRQAAQTNLTLNQSTGVFLRGQVNQTAPLSITIYQAGTGIRTDSDTWNLTQTSVNTIILTGQSVGYSFNGGGIWQPSGLTRIGINSTSSIGVQCNNVQTCCAALALSWSYLLFSGPGNASDCPAPSPSPSPSPSPLTSLVPVTMNVTAAFDPDLPIVALTGSITNNDESSSKPEAVGVEVGLGSLQMGTNTEIAVASLDLALDVHNITDTTVYTYTASGIELEDGGAANLEQSFTFLAQARELSFAGVNFTARAATIKWSLNFTITAGPLSSNGFTLRYHLASLGSLTTSGTVHRRDGVPQPGMTTFLVSLPRTSPRSLSAVAQVELLNMAVVDGVQVPLTRIDLDFVENASSSYYELVLEFPACNTSVEYDPSVGLGVLLGSQRSDGSSGVDTGLVVGVSVGVGLAVLVVAVIIGAAVGWSVLRRFGDNRHGAINFDAGLEDRGMNEDDLM